MGFWGVKLYENDVAMDVKDAFEGQYRKGKTAEEITKQLEISFQEELSNEVEAYLFWEALAEAQWRYGVLLPQVKEKALFFLNQECPRKEVSENPKSLAKWQKDQNRLLERLLSPMPPVKKMQEPKCYHCQWKMGDVFAWKMVSDLAKTRGLEGQYLLIQKAGEGIWHPKHTVPIVYVKLTKDGRIPENIEEYDRLPYVQTAFTRYEDRFFPFDGRPIAVQIEEKSAKTYEVDDYGFLPEFRALLLNTSQRVIPKELIYVGNFFGAKPPEKEFVPHDCVVVAWKLRGQTFETKMIKYYCMHNLRELECYKETR